PRGQHQQAAAFAALAVAQTRGQLAGVIGTQRNALARTADQHADTGLRQVGEAGAGFAAIGQPFVVHRIQRAERAQDVGAVEAVVPRSDHGIPVRGVDTRVEDLHGVAMAIGQPAQHAGEQGRGAAATDRHGGPWRRERVALAGGQGEPAAKGEAWRKPRPRRARLQQQVADRHLQPLGQRQRLTLVAGRGVGDHPAFAVQLQHARSCGKIVSRINTMRFPSGRPPVYMGLYTSTLGARSDAACGEGYRRMAGMGRAAKPVRSPDASCCPFPQGVLTMSPLKYLALAGLLGAAVSVQAAPVTYKLDPNHTMVLFSWNHFGYSNPTADIGLGEGTVVFDEQHPERSSVEVTLPLARL